MACASPSATSAPLNVWTRKTTTDWVFHPVGPPVDANLFQLVRASFELAQSSGALLVRPAIRTSNDGTTFDTPVAIGSDTRNNDGITYGTVYVNLTSTTNGKQLVQPGIEAKNDAGTSLEMGLVTLKLDHRTVGDGARWMACLDGSRPKHHSQRHLRLHQPRTVRNEIWRRVPLTGVSPQQGARMGPHLGLPH